MEKVVRKFSSFEEAEKADREYYESLTPAQRVAMALELRRMWVGTEDERTERLERVLTVSQLPRS
jgi:hypothetical protein